MSLVTYDRIARSANLVFRRARPSNLIAKQFRASAVSRSGPPVGQFLNAIKHADFSKVRFVGAALADEIVFP